MYFNMHQCSIPDQGCAVMGSYHTGPQLHPCQCPSGQCCIRMGSCHPHSGFLCEKSSWLEFTEYIYLVPAPNRIIIALNLFGFHCFTISINVHRTGVSFSVVVCVDLCRVVFVWTVVAAIANFILVKIELARIVEQGTVVLLCGKSAIVRGLPQACSQAKMLPCVYRNPRTLSSRIPSLSSSLSHASPWPSLSKSSCPELGRLGQLS